MNNKLNTELTDFTWKLNSLLLFKKWLVPKSQLGITGFDWSNVNRTRDRLAYFVSDLFTLAKQPVFLPSQRKKERKKKTTQRHSHKNKKNNIPIKLYRHCFWWVNLAWVSRRHFIILKIVTLCSFFITKKTTFCALIHMHAIGSKRMKNRFVGMLEHHYVSQCFQ